MESGRSGEQAQAQCKAKLRFDVRPSCFGWVDPVLAGAQAACSSAMAGEVVDWLSVAMAGCPLVI